MNGKLKLFSFIINTLLIGGVLLTACAPAPAAIEQPPTNQPAPTEKPLTKVTLRINFLPQTEYAGPYVALWKGWFKEVGLDVSILPAGQELNAIEAVAAGGDTFGIGEPHATMIARAQGVPMVHVFQGDTDAYLRYIVKKSSGIKDIKDLKGKTVSLWLGGGEWEMMCMLKKAGLDPQKDVNVVAQRVGMVPFYENKVDEAEVTTFNELQQVYRAGYSPDDIIVFRAADYGCGLVGNGIFTLEHTIKDNPEMVQAFLNQVARGWKYAFENQDETVQMFVKNFPDLDYTGQKLMLQEEYKLYTGRNAKTKGIGYLDPDYLTEAQAVLLGNKLIDQPIDLTKVYADQFWKNIPDDYKIVQ